MLNYWKQFNLKIANSLREEDGFTLLELLVVVLFISVLALLTYGSFTGQVNKARHLEAKQLLGTLARAQQVYRTETQTFSPNLNVLEVNMSIKYYDFLDPVDDPNPALDRVNSDFVEMKAIPQNASLALKAYAVGSYFSNGRFTNVFCESVAPTTDPNDVQLDTDPNAANPCIVGVTVEK